MKQYLKIFFLFFLSATFSYGQQSVDGMRVGRDANGNINKAMYFKNGQTLIYLVQSKNITKFEANWPTQKIIEYINQSLNVQLDISLATSICLERIGDSYLEKYNDFENTEKFYMAATNILNEIGNIKRAGYMYFYLGMLYHDFNFVANAKENYNKAIEIYSTLPDPFLSGYSSVLSRIYDKYKEKKDYQEAIPYLETYIQLLVNVFGNENLELIDLYVKLGDDFWNAGLKDFAIDSYLKSLLLKKNIHGAQSKEYFSSLRYYADSFWNQNFMKQAEPLYVELLENKAIDKFYDKITINSKLLEYYVETLEFRKMIPAAESLKEEIKNMPRFYSIVLFGKRKGIYNEMLNLLGTLNLIVGEFDTAEMYFNDYLNSINMSRKGKKEDMGATLISLAGVYLKMYNINKAKDYVVEGMTMLEQIKKTNNSAYASGLNVLGIIAIFDGEYEKAQEYLIQSQKSALRGGVYEIEFAIGLGTLATVYTYNGDFDKAEITFLEAISIFEKHGFTYLREYANLLGNLSLLYSKKGDFENALKFNENAMIELTIIEEIHHPDYFTKKHNQSMYFEAAGNLTQAVNLALESNQSIIELVDKNLLIWSESEMEEYISNNISRYFDCNYSMFLRLSDLYPELGGRAYDNQLFFKGLLLNSSKKLQEIVSNSNDLELYKLNKRQLEISLEMQTIYSNTINKKTEEIKALSRELDDVQKKIKNKVYKLELPINFKFPEENSFHKIKKILKFNEAAIEFVSFKYYDIVRETDSIFYCALVLRPEFQFPKIIFLCEGKQLENLLDLHPIQLYDSENLELFKKIIEPIILELNGVKNLYYSPTGLLHRFSFSAIPMMGGGVLSDRFNLYNLASTRNLIVQDMPFDGETGFLYGGIDYNTNFETLSRLDTNHKNKTINDVSVYGASQIFRGSEWKYLPGTRTEVEHISQLLQRGGMVSYTLIGQEATEESFKSLSGNSPSIIHVASHGFSFPPEEKKDFRAEIINSRSLQVFYNVDHPLMRSGIIFSGANNTWVKGSTFVGIEDGILSAYELANLDLSNTQLVVLSACETGLGDIKGNEGVFGLQRALFMSGVKSMIVSLWEVPDIETMELMTLFYGYLIDGKSLQAAFNLAIVEMKNRYPKQPNLWAGFVFIR